MALALTEDERAVLQGNGGDGAATAYRIVADAGRLLGATKLVSIQSAHIDGVLYHGHSSTRFAEHLVRQGARVAVPATLNVGAIDLLNPENVRLSGEERRRALRLMRAYEALGCTASFTCAPYQAGHRPRAGSDVAWGESNAVAFCNSVLGARTNRYGDFLDVACAIAGKAPYCGLHVPENRRATVLYDCAALPEAMRADDTLWPVLGAIVGREAGTSIVALDGLGDGASEDRLKAFGAAAAAFGAVALFHIIGATPEAPNREEAFQHRTPEESRAITADDIKNGFKLLTTAGPDASATAIAIGSPHLSAQEIQQLAALIGSEALRLPLYANTSRHALTELAATGIIDTLRSAGVTLVADTCIVTTPILEEGGVLMTNSAKFAQYAPGTIDHSVIFAPLAACVRTALTGIRCPSAWI